MGTIKQGILGGFSGKVGNIVGASWRGIDYIRSMPASVHNPRTEAQVSQRNRFSLVGKMLKTIVPIIRIGFAGSVGTGKSAFSVAMSYNVKNAVIGLFPDFEINFDAVKISSGDLYGAANAEASSAAGSISFVWDTDLLNNAAATDKVILLAFNAVTGEASYDVDAATRADGSGSLAVPPTWDGELVDTYLALYSADGKLVSISVYTGRVTVSMI
ncbi:MAG: DUF6266 family protein [Synergistaceae bacterium]|jgi:hypothetical protein|nr:DUF6266 family protein [Synergistaceae bacterium]